MFFAKLKEFLFGKGVVVTTTQPPPVEVKLPEQVAATTTENVLVKEEGHTVSAPELPAVQQSVNIDSGVVGNKQPAKKSSKTTGKSKGPTKPKSNTKPSV